MFPDYLATLSGPRPRCGRTFSRAVFRSIDHSALSPLVAPEKALPHGRRPVPSRGLDNCTANNAARVWFKLHSTEAAEIAAGTAQWICVTSAITFTKSSTSLRARKRDEMRDPHSLGVSRTWLGRLRLLPDEKAGQEWGLRFGWRGIPAKLGRIAPRNREVIFNRSEERRVGKECRYLW